MQQPKRELNSIIAMSTEKNRATICFSIAIATLAKKARSVVLPAFLIRRTKISLEELKDHLLLASKEDSLPSTEHVTEARHLDPQIRLKARTSRMAIWGKLQLPSAGLPARKGGLLKLITGISPSL